MVNLGIAHVPEARRLFPEMTVRENLLLGALTPEAKKSRPEMLEKVFTIFPRLKEREKQQAGTLSGGEQQMAAIARGLMSKPRLLMLDEPSLGLSPILVADIFRVIKEVHAAGVTVLLVEQNVFRTLEIADRAYVLGNGRVVLQGSGAAAPRQRPRPQGVPGTVTVASATRGPAPAGAPASDSAGCGLDRSPGSRSARSRGARLLPRYSGDSSRRDRGRRWGSSSSSWTAISNGRHGFARGRL